MDTEPSLTARSTNSKILRKLAAQPDAQHRFFQALGEGLTTAALIYGFATREEVAKWIADNLDLKVSEARVFSLRA